MIGPKGIDYFIGDGTPSLAGDAFVVIKASEGSSYPPPNAPEVTWYPSEQARIRATGALFGAFHFWRPSVDNAAQVANFKARAFLRPGDVIQLDAEVTDGLDWTTINTRKNDMLARLKATFPQNRVLLYTYLSYWQSIDGNVADGLWIADPSAPAGAPRVTHWVIHQYASNSVDYDIANFPDAASMRTWASGLIPGAVMEQTDKVTGNLSRGNTVGDVLADLSNLRDEFYLAPGADSNNPPPAGSRFDVLFSQLADIHAKVSAIAVPDPNAIAAALASNSAAMTQIANAIAANLPAPVAPPTADQIAAAVAAHISNDLKSG